MCALLPTAAEEAEWIGDRVAELLSLPPGVAPDGARWPDGRPDPVRPSDIAVLCRKRAQFPALRAALEARGIPVEVVGLGGLLTVPEVQDIVATLRVMHDPTAADALARLLTSPRWRIGPRDLVALGRRSRWLARSAGRSADQEQAQPGEADPDVMQQAVTDLTADPGSLVEALDDLGDPAAYSAAGYARLTALAAELRTLRGHAGRPLPELVGEVERVLGLDIEVAARPGADPAGSHADLDAFADAAAAFAGDQEDPTLGAFLAYLTAAEAEEFGLEAGRVGDTDSVKLATVHAAKGLQWAAVFVPGLSAGPHGHVFPARPKLVTRWTENPRLLPFGLRGDAADLPVLVGLDPQALASFTEACGDRELAEERRLAYVACTRAAFWLGCTGYWWGNGVSRLGPSVFLDEVRAACESGAGTVAAWAAPPAEDAQNPALAEPATASWPAAASGSRHDAVREAGDLVAEAAATGPAAEADLDEISPDDRELVAAWQRDAGLLLAERAQRRADDGVTVGLPWRLPVSSLVTVAADPAGLAQQVRRPMPRPPAPLARRGTDFHRWLEQRFGPQRLIEPGDLLGAADADPDSGRRPGPGRAPGALRGRRVVGPVAAGGRGAVRDADRRPAGPGADRRGVRRRARRRVRRRGLEDRPPAGLPRGGAGRRRAAGRLPAGLGRPGRGAGRAGPRGVLLRARRRHRASRRPARRGGPRGADRGHPLRLARSRARAPRRWVADAQR